MVRDIITVTGSWVAPANLSGGQATVYCKGPGGGGGNTGIGGGGGGGGHAKKLVTITPGNSYACVIGTGGAPETDGSGSTTFASTVVSASQGLAGSDGGGGKPCGAPAGST